MTPQESTAGFAQRCKPAASKSVLLGVAGSLWAFAGGMVAYRGYAMILEGHANPLLYVTGGVAVGVAFFLLMFRSIADRYIHRILSLRPDRPCFFAVFSLRGYLTMGFMIGLGITLRSIHAIPRDDLGLVYCAIAVPLLFSSIRFFRKLPAFSSTGL